MNDNDPDMSPLEGKFAIWREDPAINHLISKLGQSPDVSGLEALLLSALEAGWSGGFNHAME